MFIDIKTVTFNIQVPKHDYDVQLTYTLSAISSISGWTRSTFVSTSIGGRWKVDAFHPCIARLTIHLAGINITVTESPRISSLTCATHVYKLAVTVGAVALFWWYTLTAVFAGAHVNFWIPGCTGVFVVSGNKR